LFPGSAPQEADEFGETFQPCSSGSAIDRSPQRSRLADEFPPGLVDLLDVPGLGPRTARAREFIAIEFAARRRKAASDLAATCAFLGIDLGSVSFQDILKHQRGGVDESKINALIAARNAARSAQAGVANNAMIGTEADELLAQTNLLRDIFGNPFRPLPTTDPVWFAWNDNLVLRLAQAAYDARKLPEGTLDNGRLAVLAANGGSWCSCNACWVTQA
jgi:hypothetical protein